MESIFCWYPGRYSIYRMADLKIRVTLLGIEQTAPFSVQSFCDYLLRLLPLLWIGTLFFCHSSFQNRNREHCNHPCYTRKSTDLRVHSMQCSLCRITPSDSCHIPSGRCILRKIFSLVSLGNSADSRLPASNPDVTD